MFRATLLSVAITLLCIAAPAAAFDDPPPSRGYAVVRGGVSLPASLSTAAELDKGCLHFGDTGLEVHPCLDLSRHVGRHGREP